MRLMRHEVRRAGNQFLAVNHVLLPGEAMCFDA